MLTLYIGQFTTSFKWWASNLHFWSNMIVVCFVVVVVGPNPDFDKAGTSSHFGCD